MPANLGFQVPVQGAAGEASALQQVPARAPGIQGSQALPH